MILIIIIINNVQKASCMKWIMGRVTNLHVGAGILLE